MTLIRVIPEVLILTSGKMGKVNGDIGGALADLSSVLNSIGNEYDGQLRRQVESKVGHAQSTASGPRNHISELIVELEKRAKLFEAADGASSVGLGDLTQKIPVPFDANLAAWASLANLPMWLLWDLAHLGLVFLPPAWLVWFLNPLNRNIVPPWFLQFPRFPYSDSNDWWARIKKILPILGGPIFAFMPFPILIPGIISILPIFRALPFPPQLPTFPGIKLPWGLAKPVEAAEPKTQSTRNYVDSILPGMSPKVYVRLVGPDLDQISKNVKDVKVKYDRYGFDSAGNPKSDCTWYAAAAVKTASNETVDLDKLPNFGNASNWAKAANDYHNAHPAGVITGVDGIPKEGSIMAYPTKGHVALVEHVEEFTSPDGTKKYSITVSEESATGSTWNNSDGTVATKVDVPGDNQVKRWIRTITYPQDKKAGDYDTLIQFIHFDYSKSSYDAKVDPNTLA